jgi:arylsulfatase A-like enzyme
VLIIVFDALSAKNINFYGYPRETMPHITRLLERATVYHNHYASSNFTTPGTASLLTGRHPWEHRALKLGNSVKPELSNRNIFSFFDDYYSFTYSHNHFADTILSQFDPEISFHEYYNNLFLDLNLNKSSQMFHDLMKNDLDAALLFKTRLRDISLDGFLYRLLFPSLLGPDYFEAPPEVTALFPRGVPSVFKRGKFTLEDSIDWTILQTNSIPQPFLGYIHFYPPHNPYHTRIDFIDSFASDGFQPPEKPIHPVVIPTKIMSRQEETDQRRWYDEFILYVDSEFHRLFTNLDQLGILDNTLVIFTSDHGEMFERNHVGHSDPYLFDPVVKVPLIIFEPGQAERKDIHSHTSCIDLLPSLLHYSGHDIPVDLPGQLLPNFSTEPADQTRVIYAMDARKNYEQSHLTISTLMMRKNNYTVIRYSGYVEYYRYYGNTDKLKAMQNKDDTYFEVFDLENDPEELNNLALNPTPKIQLLIDEIEQYFRENIEYP